MHTAIIGTRRRIIRFKRTEQRHHAIGDCSDVETILRNDELPLGIDPPKRARHPAERVDADRTATEMRLE